MRGTRSLSDILCDLVIVRGYGRLFAREILENIWNTAIGEPYCRQTQVGKIRRGVLSVTVAHSSLLEELVAFRKAALLAVLQASVLGTAIHDIQFQVGSVVFDIRKVSESSLTMTEVAIPVGLSLLFQKECFRSEIQT